MRAKRHCSGFETFELKVTVSIKELLAVVDVSDFVKCAELKS